MDVALSGNPQVGDELTTVLLAMLDETPPIARSLFLLNRVYGLPLAEACLALEVDPGMARPVIADLSDRIAQLARRQCAGARGR